MSAISIKKKCLFSFSNGQMATLVWIKIKALLMIRFLRVLRRFSLWFCPAQKTNISDDSFDVL